MEVFSSHTAQFLLCFFFMGAVLHALFSDRFLMFAQNFKEGSIPHSFFVLCSHLTFIFAIWLFPTFVVVAFYGGFDFVSEVISGADLREPFSNFTFIFLALAPAVRRFFYQLSERVAGFIGGSSFAFWASTLLLGSLLSGVISEAAVMVLVCSAMAERFFAIRPSAHFAYLTLAVMLSVLSIGAFILPYNLTASMDLTTAWGWTHLTVLSELSWRALLTVVVIGALGGLLLRKEFSTMDQSIARGEEEPMVIDSKLLFYGFCFLLAGALENYSFFLVGIVACICVIEREEGDVLKHHQRLYLPLLIALFNYSMEVHAYLLAPSIEGFYAMTDSSLFPTLTIILAGLNEHLPGGNWINVFSGRDLSIQGLGLLALATGGGLALFSTSVNVVAKKMLGDQFPGGGISGFRYLFYSVPIAIVVFFVLWGSYLLVA